MSHLTHAVPSLGFPAALLAPFMLCGAIAAGPVNVSARGQQPPDVVRLSKQMPDGRRWMVANLDVPVAGSYCFDDVDTNCRRYGRMYTWEAAQTACRALGAGWRLPTDDDWRGLAKQYGGIHGDGTDGGTAAYAALRVGGTSGFDAVLGGNRDERDGRYARLEAHGFYWTASVGEAGHARFYNFGSGGRALYRQESGSVGMAISVRCVSGE